MMESAREEFKIDGDASKDNHKVVNLDNTPHQSQCDEYVDIKLSDDDEDDFDKIIDIPSVESLKEYRKKLMKDSSYSEDTLSIKSILKYDMKRELIDGNKDAY